jgi:hypothetical protein
MWTPEQQKAIDDRVTRTIAEEVSPEWASPGTDALIRQWEHLTFELQEAGVSPSTLCTGGVNEISAARAEFASAEHQAAR